MKIRSLLLGSLALAGLGAWGSAILDDDWIMPNFVYTGGGASPSHRSSGGRAHRRWRKRRSAGKH